MMAALTLGVVRISTALLRSGGSYEEAPSVGPSPCGYSSQHIVLSASVFFFFQKAQRLIHFCNKGCCLGSRWQERLLTL